MMSKDVITREKGREEDARSIWGAHMDIKKWL
jgi:hypothetical protein